ncbi:MAG: TAT-variant-translocated molybdopterin oxidoreductase, partial [Acidobacteriota bacterium]|nr:TAT-variant-translocated molybdopterin oxidoreductase [Acidobacteriota bacterium]
MHIKDTFPALYKIRQARRKPLEMEDVRQKLGAARGKEYWRSLDELADSEEFAELLHREFPQAASEMEEGTDRRTFIKLMGASLALAGVGGCIYQPPETIIPYVRQPEGLVPGKPLFFATAMSMGGAGVGLLVRSNMGRPTKIEGNELHPASLGATDLFSQASILTLYDPDRSQTLINRGEIGNFTSFLAEMSRALESQSGRQGAGLRFLTETISSPTVAAQMQEITQRFPAAKWHQYEPAGGNAGVGARLAFGEPINTIYNFAEADRVLSLDADFLSCGPASLRYARDFAGRRRLAEGKTEMNRLYVIETTATQTGMVADHRLAIRPSEMESFARAIGSGLGAPVGGGVGMGFSATQVSWVEAVTRDLQAHRGRSIVIAGDEQPPVVHALAHAINGALGNVGTTVTYTEPVEANPVDQLQSLRELIADIDNGLVELLVIVDGNPVYNTPADLKLDKARLDKVPLRVHLGLYQDETADLCQWHINQAHYLEAWSDTRAFDGTATIIQPLIAPLYA